ncbi:DgyrCDS1937 [Dimorphilus gyrociliatus]|uniref:DgyrCDS1937 n=1 Tax=Dimorphilus gyrociliatus TaxID=2664684 RepID=A0A7I8VA53_9ANNE|nr:DgyrCDS1937 [Dimorphilus gyrociliatus]
MDMIRDNLKIEALKEPRGFIRVLLFVLAILAFATTTSLTTRTSAHVKCLNNAKRDIDFTVKISYPFDLTTNSWKLNPCAGNDTLAGPYGNFSAASQFYVFVGVMAFLISLASIGIYTFASDRYDDDRKLPLIDLIVTVIWCLLWLIASSAWADKFTQLRHYSDPSTIAGNEKHLICPKSSCSVEQIETGQFAKLYVSLIFGFLNVFVWGFNCWFLYKETSFFRGSEPPPVPTEQAAQPPADPYPQQFPQGSM